MIAMRQLFSALCPEFALDKYVAKRDSVVGIIPESLRSLKGIYSPEDI